MCGIVGYIGHRKADKLILDGLKSLEYRGYDSSGAAFIESGSSKIFKQIGKVDGLENIMSKQKINSGLGIGHTRWATHGSPSMVNAHPHSNEDQSIIVVHNGIIENHLELKYELESKGYIFKSETDTEVIPFLIDYYFNQDLSFENSFKAALKDLKGAYAIAAISTLNPEIILAAKLSSPLVIGVGKNEHFLASDPSALSGYTKKVIYLQDLDVAKITKTKVTINNLGHNHRVKPKIELIDYDNEKAQLGSFDHFMIKEIFESPATINNATLGRVLANKGIIKLGGLESVSEQLKYIERIVIVACGSSFYAGLVGEYLIEELAGIPVEVQLASEFKYREEPFSRSTALLAISQSGETADTIAALKKVSDYGILRLGIVNSIGSTIARMTDAGVYCHAGPEQAVASTKAFIAQVTVLTLIALYLSNGQTKLYRPILKELDSLPEKAQTILNQTDEIKKVAEKYKGYKDFLYIGRHFSYPVALEGALKLKEVSYIHAEGYAAGEMKHGPLAMIDKEFPTFALASNSLTLEKTYSNIEEIRARQGKIIAVSTIGNKKILKLANDVIYIPDTLEQLQPVLQSIVIQLFSYYMAVAKGFNVDRPRNLAKSVTVE
jgi:glucosamine--fructose-6-phosphate aminotransferase (isomerizing)